MSTVAYSNITRFYFRPTQTTFSRFSVELWALASVRSRLALYTLPVVLGMSRVALGRHFLSDVLAGEFM